MYNTRYHAPATQDWHVGEIVNIGFVKGLEIIKKIATPGDHRPDFYALWQANTNRFYAFQPHYGLARCSSLEEAMNVLK